MGITTVIYLLIPELDTGAQPGFAEWLRVFQIVSPTITLSGGAGIVLSSIIYARQAQKAEQYAAEVRAEAEARIAEARAEAREARAAQAEAQAAQAAATAQVNALLMAELARMSERLARLENGSASGSE